MEYISHVHRIYDYLVPFRLLWLDTKIVLKKNIYLYFLSQVTEKPAGAASCPSNVIPEDGYIDDETIC